MLKTSVVDLHTITPCDFDKKATVYWEDSKPVRTTLLYIHGGGLLYGNREDLPELHIDTFTQAGYAIIALDYPLAPAAKLPEITADVIQSVNHYSDILRTVGIISDSETVSESIPYFLWGRSAGAYLALLAGASEELTTAPAGILSYYGYGFLTDGWYDQPSFWYQSLPTVTDSCLAGIPAGIHCNGPLETHYSIYIYARQKGLWKDLIYSGREKFFFLDYSLRLKDTLRASLFAAHSTGDNDVPFTEFNALTAKYHPVKYIAAAGEHDFDRDTESPFTKELLEKTVEFVEEQIG